MAFVEILRCAVNLPKEFLCESTDAKPTEDIAIGSTAFELDTKKNFIFDGTNWRSTDPEEEEV